MRDGRRQRGTILNLTIDSGVHLRIGQGLYHFRFTFRGPSDFLIRVPFLGKAWSYGAGGSGRISWAEVREEDARGLED